MPEAPEGWLRPDWPAPAGIRALVTTRAGGFSQGSWGGLEGGGLNLGLGTDDAATVARNRQLLRAHLPEEPRWLDQVHGSAVVDAAQVPRHAPLARADAAVALAPGVVCAILVADCLPVLLADAAGRGVAAAHAGWRGLAGGVIQESVRALRRGVGDAGAPLLAWLGPAIGPRYFEVGPEVLAAMAQRLPDAARAFASHAPGRLHADLFALARQALAQEGVTAVYGGGLCTYGNAHRFYSHRRDAPTGRQAALIWRNA